MSTDDFDLWLLEVPFVEADADPDFEQWQLEVPFFDLGPVSSAPTTTRRRAGWF